MKLYVYSLKGDSKVFEEMAINKIELLHKIREKFSNPKLQFKDLDIDCSINVSKEPKDFCELNEELLHAIFKDFKELYIPARPIIEDLKILNDWSGYKIMVKYKKSEHFESLYNTPRNPQNIKEMIYFLDGLYKGLSDGIGIGLKVGSDDTL